MGINRLTTAMLRHDTHHGENLRVQHQRWENARSYDKMVWSGQQYCDIHSEGSNPTLSTMPVRDVPGTQGMVWGSCTAVNQHCVQATGRGSRLDLWANSSRRANMYTRYISANICGFLMLSCLHKIRTIWNECKHFVNESYFISTHFFVNPGSPTRLSFRYRF